MATESIDGNGPSVAFAPVVGSVLLGSMTIDTRNLSHRTGRDEGESFGLDTLLAAGLWIGVTHLNGRAVNSRVLGTPIVVITSARVGVKVGHVLSLEFIDALIVTSPFAGNPCLYVAALL